MCAGARVDANFQYKKQIIQDIDFYFYFFVAFNTKILAEWVSLSHSQSWSAHNNVVYEFKT